MRDTLEFIMRRAGEDAGLSEAETEALLRPDEIDNYDLGDGAMASRTRHRSVPDGFGEYTSQGGCRVEVYEDGSQPGMDDAANNSYSLAANQSIKNYLGGLPYGGGKAKIFVPRSIYDDKDAFYDKLAAFVDAHQAAILSGDGLGPDMRLRSEHMDHMADTLVGITGNTQDRSRFTGKSIGKGGVPGREDATSYGMLVGLEAFLQAEGESLEGKTFVIEGGGNVGSNFHRLIHEAGGLVLGMSDINRAVVARDMRRPLVPDVDIRYEGTGIGYFDEDQAYSRERPADLHAVEADVFVFAGPSGSETAARRNVGDVVAMRQLCGANTPKDRAAIEYAERNGKIIYPDVVVNLGGVVGSFVERDTDGKATEEDVRSQIDARMRNLVAMVISEAAVPMDYLRAANEVAMRGLHARDKQLATV